MATSGTTPTLNPRMLSEDSIMAPFEGLFDAPRQRIKIVDDGAGNRTLEKTPFTQALFDFGSKDQLKLTPNSDGLLFVPMQARGKFPLIWTPNKEYAGDTVGFASETDDLHSLIAYVQKLGMNRGKWRDLFEPQEIEVTDVTIPRSAEWIARQGGLRTAVHRLPRRQRGWQRAGRDLYVQPTPAQLQRRRVQVPAEPEAGADRWRPLADHHPWRARHCDAGLV